MFSRVIHHLLRPARGNAAGVIIVFAVLLTVAANAGLLGIPLGFILLSWFFKYAYILFDNVVRGIDEPPALDINALNPWDEQRPLAQLIVFGLLGAAVAATATHHPAAATALGALFTVCAPASMAVLALERSLLKALYPPVLLQMVTSLGRLYAGICALIALYAAALTLLARTTHLWQPLEFALGMFTTLSIFSTLGGALYERRDTLGLDPWHSPERTAERQRRADTRTDDALVTDAYGLVRGGAHVKAWELLQSWLASHQHQSTRYRWLYDRVNAWPDPRYATRLTEEWLDQLLAQRRNGEALDVLAQRLQSHPTFRPKTPAATLILARLAAQGGGATHIARRLLGDFEQRFPGHPLVESARELAARVGS